MHFVFEVYANTLIDQLFNIIIEFPESEPAVRDLRICLEKTDLRPHLVSSLRKALESRLLHPGKDLSTLLFTVSGNLENLYRIHLMNDI